MGASGVRSGNPAAVLVVALLFAGCAGEALPSSAEPTPSTEATQSVPPSPVACPNPNGGRCLGELSAGTYTTTVMETTLTYTVSDGWANYEDLPGNFLLVPPGSSLEGVDSGTGDYIGLYDGVVAASADCAEHQQSGVEATAEAMAEWFADLEGMDATDPMPVSIGGLDGFVVDLSIASDSPARCPIPGMEDVPIVPILIGAGPASLHHVVIPDTLTRLYLLDGEGGRTIAIEASDAAGGTAVDDLDAVVETFKFDLGG